MKTFMIVLFTNITVICLLWLIGFSICKKYIKKEPLQGSCYTLILSWIVFIIILIELCLNFIE